MGSNTRSAKHPSFQAGSYSRRAAQESDTACGDLGANWRKRPNLAFCGGHRPRFDSQDQDGEPGAFERSARSDSCLPRS